MSRGEDLHTVVIDQEDLQPTIRSRGLEDVILDLEARQQGNYSKRDKSPSLEGNIANDNKDHGQQQGNDKRTEKNHRLKGNIASDKKDDDIVEIDNLMKKWEEILEAGYNFDKGKN